MEHNFQQLLYTTAEENQNINAILKDESIWMTQKSMAELFGVGVPAINKHLSNIFEEGQLEEQATISILEIVQQEGTRFVGSVTEKYASNNQTVMYYTVFVGLQINNYTKTAAKVAVVSACAALGYAASYAMGAIAYVAVELAPRITASLMKNVMLKEVAVQTPNLVMAQETKT